MKKYLLFILMAVFVISCSKKVEIKGAITDGNPLERIQIIDASGVGSLALVNLGVGAKGEFSGSFEAPQNGVYVLAYGQNTTLLYLKGGDKLQLTGTAMGFPYDLKIEGDAKANNQFIKDAQKAFEEYASKIKVEDLVAKDEKAFIKEFEKINADINKIYDDSAKKLKADNDALNYKKQETAARLLGLLDAYEENHGVATNKKDFKVSKEFNEVREKYSKDKDKMIVQFPMFRTYQVNKLSDDFHKYVEKLAQKPTDQTMIAELFGKFLSERKEFSQDAKDYLYAQVVEQYDMNPVNAKNYDKLSKLIEKQIKNSQLKKQLLALQTAVMGQKVGTALNLKLLANDGKSANITDLKGKPTLVFFYASWNPSVSMVAVPTLKRVTELYQSKMNFAYINFDDTKEQFTKTSSSLLKGFKGNNYWVEGGINSKDAKDFGIYGFNLPMYLLIDKDGKQFSRPFFDLQDPEFAIAVEKLTGIKAVAPQQTPEMLMPTPANP